MDKQQECHNEIMFKLGNIEGRLDGIIDRLDIVNGRLTKNEGEISNIKGFSDKLIGTFTVVSSMVVAGVSIAVNWLFNK